MTRGVVGAMAMSGVRQVTTALNFFQQTPPESLLRRTAPQVFYRVSVNRRPALVELIHWAVGAVGGASFGALPRRMRRQPWIGPAYGLVYWALFEGIVAPRLGIDEHQSGLRAQLGLIVDHALYGAVVGASPWPYAD